MADDDSEQVAQQQPIQPAAAGTGPTSNQEADINKQLFGGKTPPQYSTPKAEPVNPGANEPGDPYLKRRLEVLEKERVDADEKEALYKNQWQQIQEIQKRLQQPLPKQPEQQAYQPMPDQSQQKLNTGQIIGNVMALATLAATVFGRRHGQWGRAIQQYGIGEFLKNYAAGQHEAAHEQLVNWQKNNELIHKNNQQSVQDYKDILADRRLDMTQQMDLMKTLAYQRQDYELARAAEAKDTATVLKFLDNKEKASTTITKTNLRILEGIQKSYFTNKKVRSWVDMVREQGIDPLKDPESLKEAAEKYPMSKWVEDSKGMTESAKAGGLTPGTKKTTSGDTLATDTPLSPQQARNLLKPGDWFEGTDSHFYQMPTQQ